MKSGLRGRGFAEQEAMLAPRAPGAPLQMKDKPSGASPIVDGIAGMLGYEKKKDGDEATAGDVFAATLEMMAFEGFTNMRGDVDAEVDAWAGDLGEPAKPWATGRDVITAALGLAVTGLTAGLGGMFAQSVMNKMSTTFAQSVKGEGLKNALSSTASAVMSLPTPHLAEAIKSGDGSGAGQKRECVLACKREVKAGIDKLAQRTREAALSQINAQKLTKDQVTTVVRIVTEAVEATHAEFVKKQMVKNTCMEMWLDMAAKQQFGTTKGQETQQELDPETGKTRTSVDPRTGKALKKDVEIPDIGKAVGGKNQIGRSTGMLDTGTAGFLNIRVIGCNAADPLTGIESVTVDTGAPGGEEGVRQWLNEQANKPIRDIKMAKIIGGLGFKRAVPGLVYGHYDAPVDAAGLGEMRVAVDKSNQNWSTSADAKNGVRDWMIQRALGKKDISDADRTDANFNKGVRSFLDSILNMTLKQTGHTV